MAKSVGLLIPFALCCAELFAVTAQNSDPVHHHGACGRANVESSSICDPFHILADDAYDRIDLLARTVSESGPTVSVTITRHIDTKIKQNAGNFEVSKTRCDESDDRRVAHDAARRARLEWGSDVVLFILDGKHPTFCISSVDPPVGLKQTQIDYIQAVASETLKLGLHEAAISFALQRIRSLHPKDTNKAIALRKPSARELSQVFLSSMLPFIGFGLLDNGLMIVYGDLIEEFLGRFFPISTMAAAATGNLVSDIIGIYAAGGVKFLAEAVGASEPDLTREQKSLPLTRNIRMIGESIGITIGCLLGMTPLLFRNPMKDSDLSVLKESEVSGFPLRRETSTLENIKC